jgi:ectoine hydroxylase-related dioxygenase (phytanoyl-CoA dioxygenase family)
MIEIIRRFKPIYQVYNLFKKDELSHNLPLYKKYGLKKSYYSPISSADFKDMEAGENIHDRKDSAQVLPENPQFKKVREDFKQPLLDWSAKGYAILEGFFSGEKVDAINREIERLLENGNLKFSTGRRIMFAIHQSEILKEAGTNPELIAILEMLLGKEISLFQSINFKNGSEQKSHSDSIHMTTFPLGNLIAVWVALEDIGPEQGPLHYFPGSHKLPYILNSDFGNAGSKLFLGPKDNSDYEDAVQKEIENHDHLQKQTFHAKKGDVLIWHANLLHGGEPHTNKKLTRKSMVFHYYANDAICYHEITQRPTLK